MKLIIYYTLIHHNEYKRALPGHCSVRICSENAFCPHIWRWRLAHEMYGIEGQTNLHMKLRFYEIKIIDVALASIAQLVIVMPGTKSLPVPFLVRHVPGSRLHSRPACVGRRHGCFLCLPLYLNINKNIYFKIIYCKTFKY